MNHVWNDLIKREEIWEEELRDEKAMADHEYKKHNIELLTKQLASIKKARREIEKWV